MAGLWEGMAQTEIPETERDRVVEEVTMLFIATDQRNWPAARACFVDSVFFDMASLSGNPAGQVPAEQIISGWKEGLRNLQAIHHQVGNFLVSFGNNDASVFCYGIALHYLPNTSGQNVRRFVGTYDFHLVRQAGNWRIDRMAYHSKFVDGNLALGS